ncbi:glutathione S-transferase kappa 1 [Staphylotrichum tortipilum]|uniref:Glutathione S-transferase kappa 1 n=1 Tax=Staphylotrichum tortipilum TaxID=2831512 RepID=A0AAN6MQ38_9PEZI|nr:glutathione S-transferase kappa 1 [Staphylotrichum longicolle]
MGGKIDCYLDLASVYSYLTFLELQKNRDLLASHNVEIEFHPVLLGAINAGSGNKPPWTLPAKATYGTFDARRSIARHAPLEVAFPADLFQAGKTQVPLRVLHHLKTSHPTAFLPTLHFFFHTFWSPPNPDLTTPAAVAAALASMPRNFTGAGTGEGRMFTDEQIKAIVEAAGGAEMKDVLKKVTGEALGRGAFGAPWLWVTNGEGQGEPFFGSDRFHFVWEHLGLPYNDVTLLPAGAVRSKL